MSLTPQQSMLIRSSLPVLKSEGETITSLLYASLLHNHPDLHNLFNSVNQANGRQPRALLSVILAFAAAPGHTAELIPKLERVCQRHCSLGITPDQYGLVKKYLLEAFARVLGPEWTPELAAAWSKAYDLLARMLVGRETQLYREFGDWKGWRFFKIKDKVLEAEDFYSYTLKPSDGKPLPKFLPGQYVSVRVEVPKIGYLQSRQYSLSDAPREDCYRISIKRDKGIQQGKGIGSFHLKPGLVSNLLIDDYNIGDLISISHPTGGFHFNPEHSGTNPLVFISAGSGATPLLSILNTVISPPYPSDRPLTWVHCSPRKAPFEDHIRSLSHVRKNFTIRLLRSPLVDVDYRSGTARGEGIRREMERIEREALHLDHGAAEYFLCGPEAFVGDMGRFLKRQGVDMDRVKCEWFTTGELESA